MRIRSVTIENCKSYKLSDTLILDDEITLLVGPNAGGKSNTMDILAVVLRAFFMETYTINEGQESGVPFLDIARQELFRPLSRFLDKNLERESDPLRVEIVLETGSTDVENVQTIINNRDSFDGAFRKYRNKPYGTLDFLNGWNADMFAVGNVADFTLTNETLDSGAGISEKFREYLRHLALFMLLARDLPDISLSPPFLYFSPYRSASPQDLNATLASENYVNLLHQYNQTTSRGTSSLIKLATVFFAEKKRRLEVDSAEQAYGDKWREDKDVALATQYMQRLGYEWDLKLVDQNKNRYEIELRKDGREFFISQASSGEKEILNFLLGIFALRTRGGLLVVDEPELHLHPRWQAVLHDLFRELALSTGNQFLLSTHSPTFITPGTIANVRRVAKDESNSTRLITLHSGSNGPDPRSLLHLVNSHNNERVFFADKVVLVEGIQDRLVVEELVGRYREAGKIGQIVEILEVHGKMNFERYCAFLDALRVPRLIVADLDYGVDLKGDQLKGLVEVSYREIDEKVIKSKKSQDRRALSEALAQAIQSNDTEVVREVWMYIEGRFARLRESLSEPEKAQLHAALEELRGRSIYVLSRGEIEDYLPEGSTSVDGTISLLEPASLLAWLETIESNHGLEELEDIVLNILGIHGSERASIREEVFRRLRDDATNLKTANGTSTP